MKEPSVVEHVLDISKDNVNHLSNWSFEPKIFRNLAFVVRLDEEANSLTKFLKLIRDFLLQFTWAWDVENSLR